MPFCPKCRDEFQEWVKTCPECKSELVDSLPSPPAKILTKADPLVTIATFTYPMEAHLNRAKLESEGIDAFVADEHLVQANWLYSLAIGGVRLQVKESEVEESLSILNSATEPFPEELSTFIDDVNEHCPKCNSPDIRYETFNIRPIFLFWLILSLIDSGVILPILKRKWKCRACGYEWKPKKPEKLLNQ
jgi:predicted Zn-ribbon and HTH transcriptional regulator